MSAPFENGDQTIRQLIERIEYMTGGGRPIGPAAREKINDLARRALVSLDRVGSYETIWVSKYNEAKEAGFSDGEAEAAADHEVGRTK